MYSKGISWVSDCRIPFNIEKETPTGDMYYYINNKEYPNQKTSSSKIMGSKTKRVDLTFTKGRFPANILVSDDMLNDGVFSKSVKGRNDIGSSTYGGNSLLNSKTKMNNTDRGFNDKGSNSRYYNIDKWFEQILNG